jgi:putative membrane protein
MKNLIYLALGIVTLLSVQACQNEHGKNYNDATRVDQDGLNFIKNGIEGGLTEIKASGLALTNSSNQRVIGLAKMMIDDHTKAGEGLKKIESDKMIEGKDSISGKHEQIINALSKKSGAAFDRAYLKMMAADHEDAIKLFTIGSQNTSPVVSDFAAKTLPTIKMHLDSVNAINTSLK